MEEMIISKLFTVLVINTEINEANKKNEPKFCAHYSGRPPNRKCFAIHFSKLLFI